MPPVHIGAIIQAGVAFDPKNWRTGANMTAARLPDDVRALLALLHERGIEYVIVGGIAVLHYVAGRNTQDIDLIMATADLPRLPELVIEEQNRDFAFGHFGALRVDVLFTSNALFERVRRDYSAVQPYHEQDARTATAAGLILLKLYALPSLYRQGDLARVGLYENDVFTLLGRYHPPIEPLLAELARHLNAADHAAVREVVADIEQRIARFRAAQGEEER